jgi:hypothetical protein
VVSKLRDYLEVSIHNTRVIVALFQLAEKIKLMDENFSILVLPKIVYVKDVHLISYMTHVLLLTMCVVQIMIRRKTFLWSSADSTTVLGRSSKSKEIVNT